LPKCLKTRPMVKLAALGNSEGNAQEEDFYAALIRDPRFAREVGNVVVEFGAGAHQNILDRYLNGAEVPFNDLRKVWSDLVGYDFPADIGLINFFVTVRDVNSKLPPERRIHVWAGEPPIDWSKITRGMPPPPAPGTKPPPPLARGANLPPPTEADFGFWIGQRDSYPAGIIESKILANNKKALVIYGDGHFYGEGSLLGQVEKKHPNAIFRVHMYTGFATKPCTDEFERSIRGWTAPALAMPIRASFLAGKLSNPKCGVMPGAIMMFGPSTDEAHKARMIAEDEQMASGVNSDALLYLGKSATLTQSPFEPSIYLDPEYRREMNRHAAFGQDMELSGRAPLRLPMTDALVELNPVAPQYAHH